MTRVFISHSTKDSGFAAGFLKPFLESAGILPWCSSAGISGGVDWERRVRQELTLADWFLVVLSPDAVASDWVRAEVHWATENRKGRIAPLMVRDCQPISIHLMLGTVQFIDFRENPQAGADRLLQLLNGGAWQQESELEAGTLILPAHRSVLRSTKAAFAISIDGGPTQDVTIEIDQTCVFGRATDVDFHIASQSVSRYHARLSVVAGQEGKRLEILDLESSNGTYVNDHRIFSNQPLQPGDRVELGAATLELKQLL